jgi:hypothetical protein
MPIALDPKQTFEFTLKDDLELPEDQRTTFLLRGLTVAEEATVTDSMIAATSSADEFSLRTGTHQLTVLRLGLKGWSNFNDSEGQAVPFEVSKGHPKHITDASLDRILPRHRQEITNAILERGTVTEDEGN